MRVLAGALCVALTAAASFAGGVGVGSPAASVAARAAATAQARQTATPSASLVAPPSSEAPAAPVTVSATGGWSPYAVAEKSLDRLMPLRTQRLAREFEISLLTSAPYSAFWSVTAVTGYLMYLKRFRPNAYDAGCNVPGTRNDCDPSAWSVNYSRDDRMTMAYLGLAMSLTVSIRHTFRMRRVLPSEEDLAEVRGKATPAAGSKFQAVEEGRGEGLSAPLGGSPTATPKPNLPISNSGDKRPE